LCVILFIFYTGSNVYDNLNNLFSQASAKTMSGEAQRLAQTAEARPERRGGARHSEEHTQ